MLPKVSTQIPHTGRKPRFQGGVYGLLGALEKNTIGDTLVKEIVGINLPKILFTRTYDERLDVATSEIGNTVAFVTGGLALERLLRLGLQAARRESGKLPAEVAHWERISRSLGLYSGIFALMWAMPFVRNYVTAKRTGTDQFADVITTRPQAVGLPATPDLQASLNRYKKQIGTILGLGALGSGLSLLVGVLGIRNGWGKTLLPALLKEGHSVYDALRAHGKLKVLRLSKPGGGDTWSHHALKGLGCIKLDSLFLKDGKFSNFSGLPALLFWGLPAYGGWIHASRDRYEKREQLIKFANFVACFFGPSVLLGRYFQRQFAKKFPEVSSISYQAIEKATGLPDARRRQALALWAKKVALSLGGSVALLGVMPQWISIKMTQYRMQRARLEQAERQNFPAPSNALHRKTHTQWGHPVEAFPVGLPEASPSASLPEGTTITEALPRASGRDAATFSRTLPERSTSALWPVQALPSALDIPGNAHPMTNDGNAKPDKPFTTLMLPIASVPLALGSPKKVTSRPVQGNRFESFQS